MENEITPPTNQADIATEMEKTPPPVVSATDSAGHQFDEMGLRYDGPHRGNLIALTLLVILVAAGIGFLTLTPQGRSLVGLGTSASSTTSTSKVLSTESSSSSAESVPERDFASQTGDQTLDTMLSDLEKSIAEYDETSDFGDFDSELEFGLTLPASSSSSSKTTSAN